MTVLLIIGVVGLLVIGVLVVVLSAKKDVQVVDFSPKHHSVGSVEDALRGGQKLEAIKRYREQTGASLAQAKDAVDALERGLAPAPAPPLLQPEAVTREEIVALLREGRKIEAIKRWREASGLGLAEAKDAVEALERGEAVELLARAPVSAPRRITSEMAIVDAELKAHLAGGRMIDAIKRYRELTGLGLKESKDAIEALHDSMKS